jgi:Spy/CpxP family protein refolding chaperone
MKRLPLKLGLAGLLMISLFAVPALAQDRPAPNRPADERHGPLAAILRCLSVLDLSDSQQESIGQFLESEKPILRSLHEELAADLQKLRAALAATPQDPCAIGAALLEVEADKNAIRAELEKIKSTIESMLTLEQKAKFAGCLEAPRVRRAPAGGAVESD